MASSMSCFTCGACYSLMTRCSGCRQVHFCGQECQRRGWAAHKVDCKKKTADPARVRGRSVPASPEKKEDKATANIRNPKRRSVGGSKHVRFGAVSQQSPERSLPGTDEPSPQLLSQRSCPELVGCRSGSAEQTFLRSALKRSVATSELSLRDVFSDVESRPEADLDWRKLRLAQVEGEALRLRQQLMAQEQAERSPRMSVSSNKEEQTEDQGEDVNSCPSPTKVPQPFKFGLRQFADDGVFSPRMCEAPASPRVSTSSYEEDDMYMPGPKPGSKYLYGTSVRSRADHWDRLAAKPQAVSKSTSPSRGGC